MTTKISYENGTLTVSRVYDAPREAVFEAWVETSKVQQWWGCAQTTKVCSEIEQKVGGKYCHAMTIEGVGEMPMNTRFTVYEPPARLAYVEDGNDPKAQRVTVEFIERGEGTEVRLVHENIPDEYSTYVKAGWTAAFGKLGDFLAAGGRQRVGLTPCVGSARGTFATRTGPQPAFGSFRPPGGASRGDRPANTPV